MSLGSLGNLAVVPQQRHPDLGGGDAKVANHSLERHPSLTGEDSDMELFQYWQEQSLIPLKEDVAEWLHKTLHINITADNFMSVLDTGVPLCHLARLIQTKAEQFALEEQKVVPRRRIVCRDNAQTGTWFARDNAANFLKWCREYGVKEECLFETEGLVTHKEERTVILCLLELARIGSTYGIEPTSLIKLENEIDQETEAGTAASHPASNNNKETATASTQGGRKEGPTSATKRQGAKHQGQASKARGQGQPRKRIGSAKSVDELDDQVQTISGKCHCQHHFQVQRLETGKYTIGGKSVFVRLLKGKHVMVRVGGGWDTLQHYLATHDPCKVIEFNRAGSTTQAKALPRHGEGDDKFLYIRSKYKT